MSRPLEIADLFKFERLKQMALSPDGAHAWLTTKKIDLDNNTSANRNYRVDLEGDVLSLCLLNTADVDGIVYSPAGDRIFFVSDGQVYMADANGSNPVQITYGVGGASCLVVSPQGDRVLFTRSVYENKDLQAAWENGQEPTTAQIYGASHPKANVRTANSLMYRHWDSWCENRRNHLFMVEVSTGKIVDLTPDGGDVPPIALESGCDYDFSPDGNHIAYVMNPDKMVARSTNNSIYLLSIDGIKRGEVRRISNSDGCDVSPRFISNTKVGYCSMLTPGYEADAVRFKVYDIETGQTRLYLADFERSIENPVVVDGEKILFSAQDFAHTCIYELDLNSGKVMQLTQGRTYSKFATTHDRSRMLVFAESLVDPLECFEISDLECFEPRTAMGDEKISREKRVALTNFGHVLHDVEMHEGKCIHYAYKDRTLEGYIITPPGFDESKRYPMILLIHGGPQGAFLDSFHYRWNVEMFASRGAVVVFCNPHGSTGYGHDLTRAISRHWSDECPDAIMTFVDAVLKEVPQIDPNRMSAAGASFGGFMINWLMGHTDRFKSFVSHDGIFNTEMSGYITDELWFCDYEFGGTPFDVPENYNRHSPHRFVKNFKTPTLVIQGEQDFRCFINEGVGLFTALQYMGVESRLVYFPNEGHWVLDPADSAVWYEEVIGWMMKHMDIE